MTLGSSQSARCQHRRWLTALAIATTVTATAIAGCGSDAPERGRAVSGPQPAPGGTIVSPTTTAATTTDSGDPTGTAVTDDPDGGGDTARADGVIGVPDEVDSIQGAVDAAEPGDLVLVAAGTYHEAVDVTTDELTIRGVVRDGVVLDGEFRLENGIRVLGANGVAVENMTAQNYAVNGFFWTGVDGYRGSYLTAIRNGDYGVYAFDSTRGLFEHSYAAGSPDAGFYIGQCYPCDAVLDDVFAEHNGLGYSGTNSGGDLSIVNSTFRDNRAGIVPNSGSYELCYPERESTIVGNLVYSNNQRDTPAIDTAILAMGNGIVVPGGVRNVIARNRVWDHDKTGIGLVPFLEDDPHDDIPTADAWDTGCAESKDDEPAADVPQTILWQPQQNEVIENVVSGSRVADLAVATLDVDLASLDNCWAANTFTTSAPRRVEQLAPCDGPASARDWSAGTIDIASWLGDFTDAPPSVPFERAPLPDPPPLPDMPEAATAPARPATDVPHDVDVDAIAVPARPRT